MFGQKKEVGNMRYLSKGFCVFVFLWGVFATAEEYGARKEYVIPYRVSEQTIPLKATLSCRSWEVGKTCDEIAATDPDFLVFLKKVICAMTDQDVGEIKELLLSPEMGEGSFEKQLKLAFPVNSQYELKDITVEAVVFVDDYFYIFCRADRDGKNQIFTYIFQKRMGGGYGWDISTSGHYIELMNQILYSALKENFSNKEDHFDLESLKDEVIISPLKEHLNYISIKYNGVSFNDGVPFSEKNKPIAEVMGFLFRYWDCRVNGTLEALCEFYRAEDKARIIDFYNRMGAEYFNRNQDYIKRRVQGQDPFRIKYVIFADPIVFVYYGKRGACDVVLRNESEMNLLNFSGFGSFKKVFQSVAEKGNEGASPIN